MARLSVVLISALILTAFSGLLLSVTFNFIFFGRPDRSLVEALSAVVIRGIDCSHPETSPFFSQKPIADDGPGMAHVSWFLYDESKKKILASPPSQEMGPEEFLRIREDHTEKPDDSWLKRAEWSPFYRRSDICGRMWSLYVISSRPVILSKSLVSRQAVFFLLNFTIFVGMFFLFTVYMREKGREARAVLRQLSEGHLSVRLPVHRFEKFFDLTQEFNRMADAMVRVIEELRISKEKQAELVSELTHDLRTPLASVMAAADTLEEFDEAMSPELTKSLYHQMQEDLTYLKRLLDDLLFMANLEQINPQTQFHAVNFEDVLEKALHRLHENLKNKNIFRQVTLCRPSSALPEFQGDPALLQRLMQNLTENAVRYSVSEICCDIQVRKAEFRIVFSNDSPPLSEDDLKAWGQKRSRRRFHEDPMHPSASLGLGSSIIQRIAGLHGGRAEIRVTERDGERVWVEVMVTMPFEGKN